MTQHREWVIDDSRPPDPQLTNDGKQLLLTMGVPGNDEKHFARPTDIACLPDGTFFVTDGYDNTRPKTMANATRNTTRNPAVTARS